MDKYNCDQLKNIKVPENWIENALNVPNEKPKRALFPVKFYRFAAGIAACVVIAAAVTLSLMFGINRNIDITAPNPNTPSQSEQLSDSTSPTSAPDISSPSKTPPLLSGEAIQSGTAVTEPAEESEAGSSSAKQNNKKQNGNKQSDNKSQTPTKSSGGSEKQSETSADNQPEIEPEEEPQTEKNAETTIDDFWHSHQGEFGVGGVYKSRPAETEAYGCHFVTSVERSAAQGKTYYCRIEDGSGNTLGSGAAQKYDWGNPKWPLDLKYTADFVMYYGETYTVTFYSSNGNTVWSGSVYLKEHQTDYILY